MPRLARSLARLPQAARTPIAPCTPSFLRTASPFSSSPLAVRSLLSASRLPTLTSRPFAPQATSSAILSLLPTTAFSAGAQGQQQVRWATYGAEYQPSQVRRKRKHGFLRRNRTKNGRKTLAARWAKGRRYLSH